VFSDLELEEFHRELESSLSEVIDSSPPQLESYAPLPGKTSEHLPQSPPTSMDLGQLLDGPL